MQAAQEIAGVGFDVELGQQLVTRIRCEMQKIEDEVKPELPPRKLKKSEEGQWTMPKKPFKKDGSIASSMVSWAERNGCKLDESTNTVTLDSGASYPIKADFVIPMTAPMELGNTTDLKDYFLSLGWEPTFFNFKRGPDGKPERDGKGRPIPTTPKIQENGKLCPSLELLEGDIARSVCKWLSYRNRLSVLEGWLDNPRLAFDGLLTAASSGVTNTFRQKHTSVANVPKNKPHVLLGKEFRELFTAHEGDVLVGFDASALEDRVKGHFTFKYDNGEYARKILSDGYDPHQESADIWGIDRSIAKNGNYALGYFCGVAKLASTIKCSKEEAQVHYDAYWSLNSALKELDLALERHWESNGKAFIVGIDGRKVYSRHRHGLVNLLIQSTASTLMDFSAAWMDRQLGGIKKAGDSFGYIVDGHVVKRVIYMHDEYAYSCPEVIADKIARLGEESVKAAGEYFKLRVPLLSDAQVGKTWADLK